MTRNDVLINLVAKASGSEKIKDLQKTVGLLSNGVLTLGKNHQFYQKGVSGSISAEKAMLVIGKQAVAQTQLNTSAVNALTQAKRAEVSAVRAEAVATRSSTSAKAANTQQTKDQTVAAGAATFALTSLGQGLADAGQFGMGFAQGMRAITNNAQQVVFAMVMLQQQAGTTAKAFAMLRSVMTGPLGFLFAFQAASAALEGYLSWAQRTKKDNDDLADSFKGLVDVVGGPMAESITQADLQDRVEALRNELELLGAAADPLTKKLLGFWGGYVRLGDVFSDATEKGNALRAEIEKWLELVEKPGPAMSTEERIRAALQAEIDALEGKKTALLNELEAQQDSGIVAMREEIDLLNNTVKSGIGSTDEFSSEYERFSSKMAAIGEKVSQSQFAKLWKDGEADEFFSEKYKEFILERIGRTIYEVERLNRVAEKFGAGAAPRGAQTAIADRVEEIRRSATLVGGLGGVEGIGGDELSQMSDAALSEMDRLGLEIEARNRAGTDSWRAHWLARTEATIRASQIVGSSIGTIGESFMQIAQTGDSTNKRMFETGKKFAIAQAIISTYVGFTKALEQKGPLGIVAGAAVLASGMAKVAAIRATTMNGGGGGSASSGASGVSAAPAFFTGFSNTSQIPASSLGFPVVPLGQRSQQQVSFVIDGRNLVGVLENNSAAQQRMTGRSMVVGTARPSSGGGFVDLTLER